MASLPIVTTLLGCTIVANYTETSEHIEIEYSFINSNEYPVLIFNKLFRNLDGSGNPIIIKDLANIVEIDRALVVSKRLIPVPVGMLVESKIIPCTTLVPPSGRYSETLTLRFPIKQWTPYYTKELTYQTERQLNVYFEVGFFVPYQAAISALALESANLCPSAFDDRDQSILRVELKPLTMK